MRQIKASEVKPGMTIRFDTDGWHVEGVVGRVEPVNFGVKLYSTQGVDITMRENTLVTVLSEPGPVQPEEPTEFGARVVADGFPAVRLYDGEDEIDPENPPWRVRIGRDRWQDMLWHELVEDCSVTAIPDQDWTAPADGEPTPEVPERIEKWPENDEALRPYPWRDRDGGTWKWLTTASEWECYDESGYYLQSGGRPFYGPWDRVPHA